MRENLFLSPAERVVLSAWLNNKHTDKIALFAAEDFSMPELYELVKAKKGLPDIARQLKVNPAEIGRLYQEYNSTEPMFFGYLKELQDRKLMPQIAELIKTAFPEGSAIDREKIGELMDRLDILRSGEEIPMPAKNFACTLVDDLDEKQNQSGRAKYGLETLDRLTGGIHRKQLITVGARPGMGKSAFALQIGLNVAEQGHRVLYLPLEMTEAETYERILCMKNFVEGSQLTAEHISKETWDKISLGGNMLNELEESKNFLVFENLRNLEKIRQIIKNYRPFLVVIDQLSNLRTDRHFNSKRELYTFFTNTLKEIAMDNGVAILLAAQINRAVEGGAPTLENLKDSGSIEEDSERVILLYQIPDEKISNPKDWIAAKPMLVRLAKNRSGKVGDFTVSYCGEHYRFKEYRTNFI